MHGRVKDAKKFLEQYKRVDVAVDAYYGNPATLTATAARPPVPAVFTSKLNTLFDKYKDPDGDDITVDRAIRLCQDLGVDPEDVVLLAVAFQFKSMNIGEWNRAGWLEGWKSIGCACHPAMKTALPRLRTKFGQDSAYFQKVYNHTFEFAKAQGQRSISIDTTIAFWALLLLHGMAGGALAHLDAAGDVEVGSGSGGGWKPELGDWGFEFLQKKSGNGVSKDTWVWCVTVFLAFISFLYFFLWSEEGRKAGRDRTELCTLFFLLFLHRERADVLRFSCALSPLVACLAPLPP
ncbi:hypothetical protein K438DRAFT_1622814 [Mycena galopus ATCC 62051]|nr:hypothetical protein K438DRAFT_1622814 [Mycena galopus ATCC 62051]